MRLAAALLFLFQAGAVARTGVQGIVTAAGETPVALIHARVELLNAQPGVNSDVSRIERTDVNGRFSIMGVAPGSYRLRVTRDGYIRKEYGEFGLDEPDQPISIRSGQRLDVKLTLDPAPSVTGRISDEQGEGLPNVLVRAYRVNYDPRGARRLTPAFSAQTDDHGDYRLYWIDPGEYYISGAIVPDPIFDNPNEPPPPDGYAQTYYPGLTDPAGVTPIRLAGGAEASGIDFRLTHDPALREKRVTLRGDVMLDRSITLPGRSRLTLEPNGTVAAMISRDEPTEANGSFEIRGVDPGDYMLVAQAVRTGGRGANGRETGFVRVVVRNQDIEGIRIVPTSGVRLNGVIAVDRAPSSPSGARDLRTARVELRSVMSPVPPTGSGAPQDNGAFSIDRFYLGGDYTVAVSDLPGDLYLKSARLSGIDILETGAFHLNFQSPSDLLEIALGADGGSLKGSVYAREDDKPMARASVVLAPDEKRRRRTEQYRAVTTDNAGNFVIRGIPPGTYSVFAWKRLEPNAYLNADFLSPYDSDGHVVEIAPGENKPLGLRALAER